jgi:hypothetical protein
MSNTTQIRSARLLEMHTKPRHSRINPLITPVFNAWVIPAAIGLVLLTSSCSPVADGGSGQVIITAFEVQYERHSTLDAGEYKRFVTINYPKVTAGSAAQAKKIEEALHFSQLDIDLDDELYESTWLDEVGFTVNSQVQGLLSVTLWMEGSGVSPSTLRKNVLVDTQTGRRLRPDSLFINLQELVKKIRAQQRHEIQQTLAELRPDPASDLDADTVKWVREQLAETGNFTEENLAHFTLDDKGITFDFDYGFPFAIRALEPSGMFFLSWQELAPYVNREDVLAKFIKP